VTLDFAASYANLRYVRHTTGLCYPGRIPDGSSASSCVLSGRHPIHAPDWETHLGVQYRHPLARREISLRVDWSWTDDYNSSFSADPRLVQTPYSDLGLRVITQVGQNHDLVFWSANLLDENITHFDSLLNIFNDESYQSYLAAPRSYGVAFRFRL
jgi:hypothetical protein